MTGKEDEQIKNFIEDVDLFLNLEDIILKWMDEIFLAYIRGNDIHANIVKLKQIYPGIYNLIAYMLFADENDDFIIKSEIAPEKKEKIFALKNRYNVLRNAVALLSREDEGKINCWTKTNPKFSFNLIRNIPQIEYRILSGDKEIFYTKDDVDDIYILAGNMLNSVLAAIDICQRKNLSLKTEFIKNLNETTLKTDETIKKITEVIGKIEVSEEKSKEK